jgi:hypothetical protein
MSQNETTGRGPLSPEALDLSVHSLARRFPDIPEDVIRECLNSLNREDVRINQYLTTLAVRDLTTFRLRLSAEQRAS